DLATLSKVDWDPFIKNEFNDNGTQEEDTESAMWDAERVIYSTVGPMPTIQSTAAPTDPSVFCLSRTVNEDEDLASYFYGGLCEAMIEGDDLPASEYTSQQPDTQLCGTQEFNVDSQMLTLRGWCQKSWHDLSSQDDEYCASQRVHYASLISTIDSIPSVCSYSNAYIHVTRVTFGNHDRIDLFLAVISVASSVFCVKLVSVLVSRFFDQKATTSPSAAQIQQRKRFNQTWSAKTTKKTVSVEGSP
ncbi:hypothetical protein KIPB_004207, partial [Kipferlia bialata]